MRGYSVTQKTSSDEYLALDMDSAKFNYSLTQSVW